MHLIDKNQLKNFKTKDNGKLKESEVKLILVMILINLFWTKPKKQ